MAVRKQEHQKDTQKGLAEKESRIKELSSKLQAAGFVVRREKLKQGPGWRTISGTCTMHDQRLVFVDRKTSLDDQLSFLHSLMERVEKGGEDPDSPAAMDRAA